MRPGTRGPEAAAPPAAPPPSRPSLTSRLGPGRARALGRGGGDRGREQRVASGFSRAGGMERPVGTAGGRRGLSARAHEGEHAQEARTVPGQLPRPARGPGGASSRSLAPPPLSVVYLGVPPPSCHLRRVFGHRSPAAGTRSSLGSAGPQGKLRPDSQRLSVLWSAALGSGDPVYPVPGLGGGGLWPTRWCGALPAWHIAQRVAHASGPTVAGTPSPPCSGESAFPRWFLFLASRAACCHPAAP